MGGTDSFYSIICPFTHLGQTQFPASFLSQFFIISNFDEYVMNVYMRSFPAISSSILLMLHTARYEFQIEILNT